MIKYAIKQKLVTKPEIELPEGSQVVSVNYQDYFLIEPDGACFPRYWEVVWLEPIIKQ